MKQVGWLISRYLVGAVVPYFAFSWLLLSVILFVQQTSRYSDILFSVNLPTNLIWQLTIALIPNVIAFTCPMAMLVGTIIGLTKMQGDSELIAIRAAGVGNLQIALPIMILGLLMSGFAFLVNIKGVPMAASLMQKVALETALKKLESPIEPGVFNTEVNGYTIYVKGGDLETRTWKNIFIYSEDLPNNSLRLITSRNGRIDTTGQNSELVLENATVSTLPIDPGAGKYVSENISDLRFAIKTKRNELIDKVKLTELRPEELGLQQLSDYAETKTGPERTEAQIQLQRRIILSITPLVFCLLGTVIVLRFNRGGRGFGIAMALGVLVGFYLLTFLGEQLARVGAISVLASSLIPLAGSIGAIVWLSLSRRIDILRNMADSISRTLARSIKRSDRVQTRNLFMDLTTGLRDFDLIRNLVVNFGLTLLFLTAIFIIFTAFELWRFAGTFSGGIELLGKYLLYLLPFVYLQIAPSAAMIGTLATYVIKSRNNEIVTWTSAGQSVYRLLVPCFLLTLLLGAGNWLVQEKVLPTANRRQDETRSLIRNRGVPIQTSGKHWVASEKRIYSFEIASDNEKPSNLKASNGLASDNENASMKENGLGRDYRSYSASDNVVSDDRPSRRETESARAIQNLTEQGIASDNAKAADGAVYIKGSTATDPDPGASERIARAVKNKAWRSGISYALINPAILTLIDERSASDNEKTDGCSVGCVRNVIIYEFADNGERLQAVYRSSRADWVNGRVRIFGNVEKSDLKDGKITAQTNSGGEIKEEENPFTELRSKPSHLNTPELMRQLATADSYVERRNLSVGLQKKYATIFSAADHGIIYGPIRSEFEPDREGGNRRFCCSAVAFVHRNQQRLRAIWVERYALGRTRGLVAARDIHISRSFSALSRKDLTSSLAELYVVFPHKLLDRVEVDAAADV
ncbi:MAG: LptF/LptG family permease [Pyrinomonadaceae bacterium]